MSPVAPRLSVETFPLAQAWQRPLVADLLAGRPELDEFYRWPLDRAALPQAIQARRAQPWQAPRDQLVSALGRGVVSYGMTPAMAESLRRLADPGTVAIVTGQQPGFLGGPLFTLYKAMAAIGEAARLEQLGQPAVPIFWVANEDDDFEEIRTAWLLDRGDEIQAARLPAPWRVQQSVGPQPVTAGEFDAVVRDLWSWLPETEFTAGVMERVVGCWGRGATIGQAFGCWLTELLGGAGLLVVDPTTPAMRQLATPFLHRVLEEPLAATRLANAAGDRLEALGYPRSTHRTAELCAFYLLNDDGVRQRLWAEGDELVTPDGTRHTLAELHQIADAAPERFSTGLLIRPVLQDYLFPTAAFIVGPGELSYAAQVRPVYDHFEIAPPLMLPRYSATIIEPRLGRHLTAYDLALADVWQAPETLLAQVSRAQAGSDTEALFGAALSEFEPMLHRLQGHAAAVDATLERTAAGAANRIRGELRKLEEKVLRALRQRDETLQRRLRLLQAGLYPGGGLQERGLAACGLLARFGDGLLESLTAAFAEAGPGVHLVVRFEG